ncbi:hypothetical protein CNMCM6936_009661 [Aspergillus lentulus]|uniref:Hydrophobin n=1 Tax=Aspergillus lentulus TaxID=293939 RepID=A0AAN6BTP9_ASPLE|nr:hypothetical protein CNMCM6069_006078 [Aspergillus lentulus]KAF4169064.1 hypothetical protein CNMCM6936_009661 [Aspergillus lentulus]KAF4190179.1 hypothetical protein CNMCM7927_004909 [Aspergillus lentulus]KAF4209566.1 hypothetical protein CNMCM8927_005966 [Aspergillus lentulus]
MKLCILTSLTLIAVTAAIPVEDPTASALKSQVEEIAGQVHGVEDQETATDQSQCVDPKLCCGSLTTPLDPILDPILLALGINAAKIVGSVGLLCEVTHGLKNVPLLLNAALRPTSWVVPLLSGALSFKYAVLRFKNIYQVSLNLTI